MVVSILPLTVLVRGTAPRYLFSTGTDTVGTLEKSTGTAVPVLLLLNF